MKNNNTDLGEDTVPAARADNSSVVTDTGRRKFLLTVTASAAALALAACGGAPTTSSGGTPTNPSGGQPPSNPPTNPPPGGANRAPVWQTLPTITFTQGVAATFSIAGFVSDADGDALAITKNSAALPPGVTYDAANRRFVYDGVGAVGSTSGHVLTANDGRT